MKVCEIYVHGIQPYGFWHFQLKVTCCCLDSCKINFSELVKKGLVWLEMSLLLMKLLSAFNCWLVTVLESTLVLTANALFTKLLLPRLFSTELVCKALLLMIGLKLLLLFPPVRLVKAWLTCWAWLVLLTPPLLLLTE